MNTDEVSIEDFLTECENANQHTEEAAQEHEEPEKQNPVCGTQNHFFGDLNAKYEELAKEKKRLEERLAWIEKAQDALKTTISLFQGEG